MGGVVKKVAKVVGIGGDTPSAPKVPDYEAERKKAEAAAQSEKNRLAGLGMNGTVLGGALGDDESVKKKKLLGE